MKKSFLFVVSCLSLVMFSCGGESKQSADTVAVVKKEMPAGAFVENSNFTPDNSPKYGGTLTLALAGAPQKFHLYGTLDPNSYAVVINVTLFGLVNMDPVTYELKPGLAERWDIASDNSSVTFYLRDVLWSDDTPLTADDVLFTFDTFVMNNNARGNSVDRFTAAGKQVTWEKIDDKTIKAILPAPMPGLFSSLSQALIYPKHKIEDKIDKNNPDSVNDIWLTDSPMSDFASNGPYMLDSYIVDQKVVLKRNPNFWKYDQNGNQLPYFDTLEYVVVADAEVRLAKFIAGEVDYMTVASADFPTLKERELAGANFALFMAEPNQPVPSPVHVAFNVDVANPKLRDLFREKAFREAVEYALDRDKIIDTVYSGLAVYGGTPVLPSNVDFYNPKIESIRRKYDMVRAKEKLESIGIKDGKYADGTQVAFVITSGNAQSDQDIGYMLSESLKTLGFRVDLQILDASLAGQKFGAGDFDIAIRAFGNQPDPELRKAIWQPGRQLYYWHPKTLDATTKEPVMSEMMDWELEVFDMFEKGALTMDKALRKTYYDKWQELYAEYLPVIFVCKGMNLYAAQKSLANAYQTSDGVFYYSIATTFRK